jgi:hypothetical protein
LAGLIHSIDGTIVRLLILHFYKKYKYIPDSIHDAFRISPNQISQFYEILNVIYTKILDKELLDKLFFEPTFKVSPLLLKDKAYLENVSSFKNKPKLEIPADLNLKHMFPHED